MLKMSFLMTPRALMEIFGNSNNTIIIQGILYNLVCVDTAVGKIKTTAFFIFFFPETINDHSGVC